ncbi:cytochrome P450 [Punctularia strigosozonata HHB-11173 SS5]|uniref:cytochrome P450 n=1 Tax=Punctularia strigosozonata (strain HHB-11173) TaxID=741275 RepID=UPI0004416297|nr:cytochrome P450 [Punctularia strigosozonata HHB-11173 SS5]EIN11696.1 cytochrome P450 [Punctularia strigosozonata HHB-11173 SS5]
MLSALELLEAVAALLPLFAWCYKTSSHREPYPPGPPRKPVLGNLHQLPESHPWLTWAEWSKVYGPILYLRLFTRQLVILNTAKSAYDLLDARAEIYSARPEAPFNGNICNRKHAVFSISDKHPRFKVYRRLLATNLNPRAIVGYRDVQASEARALVRRLLESPDAYDEHIRRNAASVILYLAYGYSVQDGNDAMLQLVRDASLSVEEAVKPGRWMVDSFPILQFFPEWLPGTSWKRIGASFRATFDRFRDIPFAWTKEQIAKGTCTPSFTSRCLLREDGRRLTAEEEDIVKWVANGLYAGGSDTTGAAMGSFFLVMARYPDIQSRCQAEIDAVCGHERLPTLDDRDALPYVVATIKEILRCYPVANMGIAHRCTEDDVYNGLHIPRNSVVIANIWALLHDEATYPDPYTFNPERFLGPNPQLDSRKFAFGFGRRACPGLYFAEASLFVNITHILAALIIRPGLDEYSGQDITPEPRHSSGVVSHPEPIKCRITLRSVAARRLFD